MNVLVLSPYPECIAGALGAAGDRFAATTKRIDATELQGVDFVVSYGYRHVLREEVVRSVPGKLINLHISYLPWNRGSDPNFWSFFDDTAKGVSIHNIDAGLDTGDILAQRRIAFGGGESLATSYAKLQADIERLFGETWPLIREGRLPARPQSGRGTVHRRSDKEPFMAELGRGWETPVGIVEALGRRCRLRASPTGEPAACPAAGGTA